MQAAARSLSPTDDAAAGGSEALLRFEGFTLIPNERRLQFDTARIRLGGRAMDLLIHLASRAGKVVSHRELVEHVWAGAQVEESNLRYQVASLRRALSQADPAVDCIVSVPGRGYTLAAEVRALPASAGVTEAQRAGSLPPEPGDIIGRSAEIASVVSTLRSHRLVTLVGAGGIGKTAVCIAAAHRVSGGPGLMKHFVDLSALDDPRLVAVAVASAVGVTVRTPDPVAELINRLNGHDALIVLDNCEHVIDAAALVIERLLSATDGLRVLTTSRQKLHVKGERTIDVPMLETNAAGVDPLHCDAVQLFLARASLQAEALGRDPGAIELVGRICRELEGLPLAIELVASRVGSLGLRGVATMLEQGVTAVNLSQRTAQRRHRTLRAAFDWSYALLTPEEARLLQATSVFVGQFDLEAAVFVATGSAAPRPDLIELIAMLADKSHLVAEPTQRGTDYRLLQTTRHFAAERLREAGEDQAVARRHAQFYMQTLERAVALRRSRPGEDAIGDRGADINNVRAALIWCFRPEGDVATGVRLAAVAAPLFLHLSLLVECERWTALAVAAPAFAFLPASLRLELQATRSIALRYTMGDSVDAQHVLEAALALAEETSDVEYQIRLLEGAYIFSLRIGDFHGAMATAMRAKQSVWLHLAASSLSTSDWMVGVLDHFMGRQSTARQRCTVALRNFPIQRRPEVVRFGIDQRMLAHCANARALWLEGLPDQAVVAVDATIAEVEGIDHPVSLCAALLWTTSVLLWTGDTTRAAGRIERAARLAAQFSLVPYQHMARGLAGQLAVLRDEPGKGIELMASSLAANEQGRHLIMHTALQLDMAEALTGLGLHAEAMVQSDAAFARIEASGEATLLSDAWRVRGLILAADADAQPAQVALERACRRAGEQGARSLELRATHALACHLGRQGCATEGARLLRAIYERFDEGRRTRDLVRARRALIDLGAKDFALS